MIFGFPSMLSDSGGAINIAGVFQTTTTASPFTVPAGVTSVAVAFIGAGGAGRNTAFSPFNAGGGGAWSSIDSLSVTPGQQLHFWTTPFVIGGENMTRYELRTASSGSGTLILSAGSGAAGTETQDGSGGVLTTGGDTLQGGQSGSATNRGGSAGAGGFRIGNTTNTTSGYGIVTDTESWSIVHQQGSGRGGAAGSPPIASGGFRAIIVWGPGKGFSAGPGSFWPFV